MLLNVADWRWATLALGLGVAWYAGRALTRFLWTLPALAFMPIASRRLARWVVPRNYSEEELLRADGADDRWVERRRVGLERLADRFQSLHGQSTAWGNSIRDSFSDLRFTDV